MLTVPLIKRLLVSRRCTLLVYGCVISEYFGNVVILKPCEVSSHARSNGNEPWKTWKLRNTQNSFPGEGDLAWPSLINYTLIAEFIVSIYKLNATKFGAIFIFNMLSAILAVISHRINLETRNKNWILLRLCQSSTSTCCWPSSMAAITRIYKSG